MLKPIRLFSLLLLAALALAQQTITKEFDVKVELTGKLYEEKPKLSPPNYLPIPQARELDLSYMVLEAPKSMEFVQIEPIKKSGVSCGEPKDALSYRLGVDYYLQGKYDLAEEELGKVVLMPNSAFGPMAEYVLGIIAYSKGQKERALELFKNSCSFTHMYKEPACEAYYALSLILKGSVPENQKDLWKAVKAIKEGKPANLLSCDNVVFVQYCQYVSDFIKGREHLLYRDSTRLRSGILAYFGGDLKRAKELFKEYSSPGRPYRDVALYYLSLIDYKEGREKEALKYASILESINPYLSKELYALISEKDVYLSRLTYTLTKDVKFLEKAGIIAYNSGDYALALRSFLEAGNTRYAVYSAINMGDYKKVLDLLKDKKKDREDYLWLLEALYWSGEDMSNALSEVAKVYPDLYKEYKGWESFRRGDWLGALSFFEDPYYKALALYNLKKYKEVIDLLQGRTDERSRLIKARSALMMGNAELARSFLTGKSEEEFYLLGLSYFLEGNYQKAVEFFEKVPASSPSKAKALFKMGESYYNMGKVDKAKESYFEVLRRFPDSEEAKSATLALLDFAGKSMEDEELEKVLEDYMKREKNPPPEIIYHYASLLARKGNKKEAEKLLLKLLDTPIQFKAILRMAELEEEPSKRLVLLYKVYKESPTEEERKRARDEIVKIYSSLGDTKSLADILAEGDRSDKVKAIGLYLSVGEAPSALTLAQELIKANYRDQEFERYLLDLYRQTKDTSLLDYLLKSPEGSLRGQALYLYGLELLRRGDNKKALEHFVEISLNHKGEPYYNSAVLEGARILIKLGAKRDASCMLDRFELKDAKPEEVSMYNNLKRGLPKCEVK